MDVKTLSVRYDTRTFQYPVHNSQSPVAMSRQKYAVQNINTKKRVGENSYVKLGVKI
jgi:hypothetical protein